MGKSIFNCEKSGAGQIAKVCNNMALAIEMIGVSESLAMGKKLGMD
jgi:3-hydroxyisobutyrate dehydrogenase